MHASTIPFPQVVDSRLCSTVIVCVQMLGLKRTLLEVHAMHLHDFVGCVKRTILLRDQLLVCCTQATKTPERMEGDGMGDPFSTRR
jgi:hypothetical protein